MGKWVSYLLIISLVFLLLGCAEPTTPTASSTKPTETTVSTTAPMDAAPPEPVIISKPLASVCVPLVTDAEITKDGQVLFHYTYPHMSLVLQDNDVASKVILDFLNRVDSTAATAEQLRQAAISNYNGSGDWTAYLCQLKYEPMRIDQGVLSLFGALSTYSGGMHPDHTNISVNYDLLTGDILTLGSIMHMDATKDVFCNLVLAELETKAQQLYLYSDYQQGVAKRFAQDESQDEDFYFTTTGLCFYFSPYEIAPYSSGTVTVEIPYEKLVGVIHDAYFPSEKHPTNAQVQGKPLTDADLDDLGQISEAILTPGGQMYLLTANNLIENVKLHLQDDNEQTHTFFAAENLSVGSSIVIEATEEELSNIYLSYENASGTQLGLLP